MCFILPSDFLKYLIIGQTQPIHQRSWKQAKKIEAQHNQFICHPASFGREVCMKRCQCYQWIQTLYEDSVHGWWMGSTLLIHDIVYEGDTAYVWKSVCLLNVVLFIEISQNRNRWIMWTLRIIQRWKFRMGKGKTVF